MVIDRGPLLFFNELEKEKKDAWLPKDYMPNKWSERVTNHQSTFIQTCHRERERERAALYFTPIPLQEAYD